MERTRVKLAVYVDLDPVPGEFGSAESAKNVLHSMLRSRIPHYNPHVAIENRDVHGSTPAATDAACE